eukprot:s597_g4.t1
MKVNSCTDHNQHKLGNHFLVRGATVRSASGAMDPAFLAGLVCVQGRDLSDYKTTLSNHLNVETCLQKNHCIACKKSDAIQAHYSENGRLEYERTGVCERCWDCLMDPQNDMQAKRQQCDKLNARGLEQTVHWVSMTKGRHIVRVQPHIAVWIADVNAGRKRFGNPFA